MSSRITQADASRLMFACAKAIEAARYEAKTRVPNATRVAALHAAEAAFADLISSLVEDENETSA